ncbi:MAG: amidase [Gaiellaceae bacterium]
MEDTLNAGITWLDEPLQRRSDGPLAGRTLLVKDLIDTAGIRTTYGSKIYADHVPEQNATVVERVLDAGAVVLGKANLPEFAWSVAGYNPWYGTVHNPAHPGRTTGGSSAGNAAAIAGGLCDLGIGTDTGCSIRLPAACCEIVGLKPAWSRIPIEGIFPVSPTLDTVGPMGKTVEDVALLWSALSQAEVPEPRLAGVSVGLLRQPPEVGDGRQTERSDIAEQWVSDLERLGANVVDASIPNARANTFAMFGHEALESHRATFPNRAVEYAETIGPKLRAALATSPEEVEAGYRALEEWRRYEPPVDLYLSPCYAVDLPAEDAIESEIRLPLSSFMRWVNLTGWAGLAIGNMQLIAPRDETVLAAGLALERG